MSSPPLCQYSNGWAGCQHKSFHSIKHQRLSTRAQDLMGGLGIVTTPDTNITKYKESRAEILMNVTDRMGYTLNVAVLLQSVYTSMVALSFLLLLVLLMK